MPIDPKETKDRKNVSKNSGKTDQTAADKTSGKTKKTAGTQSAKADIVLPKKERTAAGKAAQKTKTAKPKTRAASKAEKAATTGEKKVRHKADKPGVKPAAMKKEPPSKNEAESAKMAAEQAKNAAAAAREAAAEKRAAAKPSQPPVGSIYANAIQEGDVIPDLLEMRNPSRGGIYAAAVQNGSVSQVPPQEERSSIALELGEGAVADPAVKVAEEESIPEEPKEQPQPETEEEPAVLENEQETPNAGLMPTFGRQGKAAEKAAKKAAKKEKQQKRKKPKKLKKQTALGRAFARILRLPPLRAIGGFLYLLGFSAECRVVQAWRFVRDMVVFLFQILAWVFGGIFRAIGRFFGAIFRDLAEPFVRFRQGLANVRRVMKEEKESGGGSPIKAAFRHFTSGVKAHGHLLGNIVGFVMPLVAAAVFVFVIGSVLGTNYALAVTVEGQTIGYITDETVLEDAKAMLRGRLRLAGDQNMEDWKFDSSLTVARADSFTSKDQLVNAMLRNSAVDIVEGTGLYVDGDLVAVTTDGDQLQQYLDSMLKANEDPAIPDGVVSFVNNVECDPSTDDVFLESSVQSFDELVEELNRTVSEEVRYTTREGDTLGSIARNHNILFETLIARNDQFEGRDINYEPNEGEDLLIRRAQPFLQVQTTVRHVTTEPIPFPVVEQETDTKAKGYRGTLQSGQDGLQEVQDDYVYIEGELVDQVRVEDLTRVIEEPVDEIIEIGTFDFSDRSMRGYNEAYMWPVPDYTYSSRGMSAGHRGRDINGPEGTPIYAANAGVVITSGWHYSYGNHVVIQHPDGLLTLYGHCSYLEVQEGDAVQQGQYIANVGNTGFSFGNHLHLEFQRQGGGLLNPDDYVVAPHGFGH